MGFSGRESPGGYPHVRLVKGFHGTKEMHKGLQGKLLSTCALHRWVVVLFSPKPLSGLGLESLAFRCRG